MGGEKRQCNNTSQGRRGSPPRGRGKVVYVIDCHIRKRITPAWAGKRFFLGLCHLLYADHPRVGGEKHLAISTFKLLEGSPPRGRGKVFDYLVCAYTTRITPAWAGKSFAPTERQASCKDHPRVGGEKGIMDPGEMTQEGSPPRGRGKVVVKVLSSLSNRITPAWAGKSQ